MKKCASELQLEAFIRESGEHARAAAAAGRSSPRCGGPGEPGGSGVFSPGAGGALPGVGFADSNTMDDSSWWYGSVRTPNPVMSRTASVSGGKTVLNVNNIPPLNGTNYRVWREKYELELALGEIDMAITTPCPIAPQDPVRGADETDADFLARQRDHAEIRMKYDLEHRRWILSNRKCLMVAKATIEEPIRGSIPECLTAIEYLERVKNQFTGSAKATASTLIKELVTMKYNGGSIRDHIVKMSSIQAKLTPMEVVVNDQFLLHLVFHSLPREYETFTVNYNMQPEKWDIEKLIAMCVQEEERLKSSHGDSAYYVKDNKKRNFRNKNFRPQGKSQWEKGSTSKAQEKAPQVPQVPQNPENQNQNQQDNLYGNAEKDQCKFCFKRGHYKKDCPDFMKWLMKKGLKWEDHSAKRRKNN